MYKRREYRAKGIRWVTKYYPGNFGAPGQPRGVRQKRTPADVAAHNERERIRRVQRLIKANFDPGDIYLTLTFAQDQRPETEEEARRIAKNFRNRVKREYKKAGQELRWISCMEIGKRGAVHFHMILNDVTGVTKEALMKHWTYGHPNIQYLYADGDFYRLAEYIQKAETKAGKGEHRYQHSRNLITPEPVTETVHAARWKEEPPDERDWKVDRETVYNGINPLTGMPYQEYVLRKVPEGKDGHGKKRVSAERDRDRRRVLQKLPPGHGGEIIPGIQ